MNKQRLSSLTIKNKRGAVPWDYIIYGIVILAIIIYFIANTQEAKTYLKNGDSSSSVNDNINYRAEGGTAIDATNPISLTLPSRGIFDSLEKGGIIATFLDKYKWTRYTFGPGDEKNILQRGLSILGYGNDSIWEILTTFLSIGIAALICGWLLKLLNIFVPSDVHKILDEIKGGVILTFIQKKVWKFIGLYVLIIGAIYLLINVPIVRILKPILWPLTTDFGAGILWLKGFWVGAGIYALRGITMGLFSFLVFVLIIILMHAHSIIVQVILKYQSEKRRIEAQRGYEDTIRGFQTARDLGRTTRTQ